MNHQLPQKQILPLKDLVWLFLKYGFTGFGGPAVVIAMMEEDIVQKKKWLTREHFLDLVGATNLIPGPNSTEMAIHIGYITRGWSGLTIAGLCFILPAAFISLIFAFLYVALGSLPQVELLFFGIRPVIIAVILGAVYRLGKKAAKGWQLIVIAAAIIPLVYLFGEYTVIILLGGGIVGMLWLQLDRVIHEILHKTTETGDFESNEEALQEETSESDVAIVQYTQEVTKKKLIIFSIIAVLIWGSLGLFFGILAFLFPDILLFQIGFFFYGIGSILYGSGYVLIAYIRQGLVQQNGWLTEQQLLDSVAIGQFTPGPILSTSTVIGFIVNGYPGAAIATFGIFFPSFLVVIILNPVLMQLRESRWASSFLDAINISAVATMLVISFRLGEGLLLGLDIVSSVVVLALMIGALCVVVFAKKINAAVIVVGGAIIGVILKLFFL
jgi:chromate transporter